MKLPSKLNFSGTVFSSPELKAQVSFSELVVRRPSVNFYIFDFFSRTTGPILNRLATNHPWVKGIQVYSNKGPGPLQRGDNHKNIKMGWGHLNIFFSRTIGPILTSIGTNHPWVKGIQVCSKEGDSPSPRGDNSKRVKIH
jgi:hypothetical protein